MATRGSAKGSAILDKSDRPPRMADRSMHGCWRAMLCSPLLEYNLDMERVRAYVFMNEEKGRNV